MLSILDESSHDPLGGMRTGNSLMVHMKNTHTPKFLV